MYTIIILAEDSCGDELRVCYGLYKTYREATNKIYNFNDEDLKKILLKAYDGDLEYQDIYGISGSAEWIMT